MGEPWRPTKNQLSAAENALVPDVIAADLDVIFCGINPGLYSGAVGHHFARPGNRFWPTLHSAGFTDRVLSPFEERELLRFRLGITNLVARATATAETVTREELRAGARKLPRKMSRYRPKWIAFLGLTAYRTAFEHKNAVIGPQEKEFGPTRAWLLPNPSGLSALWQLPDLARVFSELRSAARPEL